MMGTYNSNTLDRIIRVATVELCRLSERLVLPICRPWIEEVDTKKKNEGNADESVRSSATSGCHLGGRWY